MPYFDRVPQQLDIVIDFLRQQQARGLTHVDLDDRARQFLIQLSKQKKSSPSSPANAEPTLSLIHI